MNTYDAKIITLNQMRPKTTIEGESLSQAANNAS